MKKKIINSLISLMIIGAFGYAFLPHVLTKFHDIKSFNNLNLEVKRLEYGNGDHFEYVEGGEGRTLIFVHGFQSSKSYWFPYFKKFINDYKIIALDLPGHGKSSKPKNQKYDLQSLAQTFEIFIEKKELENFHLIGTSMGGGVVSVYAYNHPSKVRSMVLINPLGIDQKKKSDLQQLLEIGKNILFPTDLNEFDEMALYVTGKTLSLSSYIKKHVLTQMVKKYTFFQKAFNELLTKTIPLDNILPLIETHTLILIGQKDRIIHPESYEYFVDLMPNVEPIRFKSGAHVFVDQYFEKAATEIDKFLKTH